MGCDADKERKIPILLCDFEKGNDDQKDYCLKLKDNFQHKKTIKYQIKSADEFSVKFKLNGKIYNIQNIYDSKEAGMNKTLQEMYTLLDNN